MASSSSETEEILVLYGSQTGNSEGAAQEIASLIPRKLASCTETTCTPCTARCMHLDDFLEMEKAKWTRLVVIVCSSYGVGQAPIGARKFRDVCDEILENQGVDKGGYSRKVLSLEGVTFALLGLGDSHYTTFFKNPTTINEAMTAAGAVRVGELGKADASGTGNMEQSKVIERWIDTIWEDLEKVVKTPTVGDEVLDKARVGTWELCLELFPEWKPKKNYAPALGGVILSVLIFYFLQPRARF